jgi:hypothetical protein
MSSKNYAEERVAAQGRRRCIEENGKNNTVWGASSLYISKNTRQALSDHKERFA